MKMGQYVEIQLSVRDAALAQRYYEALGWQPLGPGVLTDGCVNIRLIAESFISPRLAYAGSDVQGILQSLNSSVDEKAKRKTDQGAELTDPSGIVVRLSHQPAQYPMPAGSPTTRTPLSMLGLFGEFTIPTSNLRDSMFFWTQLGYEALHTAQIPYPYAILSDGLLILGLHEGEQASQALTYFALDMPRRIEALQQRKQNVHIFNAVAGQPPQNAMLTTPDGQAVLLFTGMF